MSTLLLTISSLIKCQVTWLWNRRHKYYLSHIQNTNWRGNWERFAKKKQNSIITVCSHNNYSFLHSVNPIYGTKRSFEVLRSVKLHKSCLHWRQTKAADSLFTVNLKHLTSKRSCFYQVFTWPPKWKSSLWKQLSKLSARKAVHIYTKAKKNSLWKSEFLESKDNIP